MLNKQDGIVSAFLFGIRELVPGKWIKGAAPLKTDGANAMPDPRSESGFAKQVDFHRVYA